MTALIYVKHCHLRLYGIWTGVSHASLWPTFRTPKRLLLVGRSIPGASPSVTHELCAWNWHRSPLCETSNHVTAFRSVCLLCAVSDSKAKAQSPTVAPILSVSGSCHLAREKLDAQPHSGSRWAEHCTSSMSQLNKPWNSLVILKHASHGEAPCGCFDY